MVSPRKSRSNVGWASRSVTGTPRRASSSASMTPPGPPPTTQQAVSWTSRTSSGAPCAGVGLTAVAMTHMIRSGKGARASFFPRAGSRTLPVVSESMRGYDGSMEPTAPQTPTWAGEAGRVPPADRVRIVSTPGICGGRPRVDGHRITVEDVAIWHERMGMSPDEIVSAYPTLTLSDVHAALAYYYEYREQVDADIREGERFVAEMKAKSPPSLVQQKLRQRKADA